MKSTWSKEADVKALEAMLRHARHLRAREICAELSAVRREIERQEDRERELLKELDRIDPLDSEDSTL